MSADIPLLIDGRVIYVSAFEHPLLLPALWAEVFVGQPAVRSDPAVQQDLLGLDSRAGVFVQHAQDEVLCVVGQAAVEKGRQVVDGRLAVADPPCGLFAHSERQRCEQKDAEEAPPARCPSASSTCTSSGSNRGSQSVGRS